jgi:peptidoglycan/LPS O-acetylase OafA/YrhL
MPIFFLIAYTMRAVWQQRRDVWRIDRLTWLAAVVLFVVIVDSNFKVTLRQPYSGIFAFFLWGVLLARLRTMSRSAPAQSGPAHASRSSGGRAAQ